MTERARGHVAFCPNALYLLQKLHQERFGPAALTFRQQTCDHRQERHPGPCQLICLFATGAAAAQADEIPGKSIKYAFNQQVYWSSHSDTEEPAKGDTGHL